MGETIDNTNGYDRQREIKDAMSIIVAGAGRSVLQGAEVQPVDQNEQPSLPAHKTAFDTELPAYPSPAKNT